MTATNEATNSSCEARNFPVCAVDVFFSGYRAVDGSQRVPHAVTCSRQTSAAISEAKGNRMPKCQYPGTLQFDPPRRKKWISFTEEYRLPSSTTKYHVRCSRTRVLRSTAAECRLQSLAVCTQSYRHLVLVSRSCCWPHSLIFIITTGTATCHRRVLSFLDLYSRTCEKKKSPRAG